MDVQGGRDIVGALAHHLAHRRFLFLILFFCFCCLFFSLFYCFMFYVLCFVLVLFYLFLS